MSITGLYVTPPPGTKYVPGSRVVQALDVLLNGVVGMQKKPHDAIALDRHLQVMPGGLRILGLSGDASEPDEMRQFLLGPAVALRTISWCRAQGFGVELSDARIDTLRGGVVGIHAWEYIKSADFIEKVGTFPPWYSRFVFLKELSYRKDLLLGVAQAIQIDRAQRTPATRANVIRAISYAYDEMLGGVNLLVRIEHDDDLFDEPGRIRLFGVEPGSKTAAEIKSRAGDGSDGPAPQTQPDSSAIVAFLTFIGSQRDLVKKTRHGNNDPLRTLVQRFDRFLARTGPGKGDDLLKKALGGANTRPHPATFSVYPKLQQPYFDAATGTDHAFTMQLMFPDVFDAFARYTYEFNYVEVPASTVAGRGTSSELDWQETSDWDPIEADFFRAGLYALEDVETTISSIQSGLGVVPGVAAISLVAANSLLRFVSTGIRLLLETITEPRNQQRIVLPHEGLFLVRAQAVPVLEGDEEIVRAPSVAYMPVYARSPRAMARRRAEGFEAQDLKKRARLAELQKMLAEPVSWLNQSDMEAEVERLIGETADARGRTDHQIAVVEAQLKEQNKPGAVPISAQQRTALERSLKSLRQLNEMRAGRAGKLTHARTLRGSFVGDEGQTIPLLLEAAPATSWIGTTDRVRYYVSDISTPKSGHGTAAGARREEAIVNALVGILSGAQGYGRGYASVVIDGVTHTRRIKASLGSLAIESVENLATVASLAAIVAAPFTGGTSLYLLVPIGLVGAIPAAYRLATRADSGTLRLDLESVMDVLNIVGGVVGLSQIGVATRAASLASRGVQASRALRLANNALMIAGVGDDGLGVLMMAGGLMHQIEQTKNLPPGLRAARIAEILGGAMMNAGIMAGGAMMARRVRADVETQIRSVSDPRVALMAALESPPILGEHHLRIAYRNGEPFLKVCSTCFGLESMLRHLVASEDAVSNSAHRQQLQELSTAANALAARIRVGASEGSVTSKIHQIARKLDALATADPKIRAAFEPGTWQGPLRQPQPQASLIGLSGAEQARALGWPAPERGFQWRKGKDGFPTYQRNRNNPGPRMTYDPSTRKFVRIPDAHQGPPVQFRRLVDYEELDVNPYRLPEHLPPKTVYKVPTFESFRRGPPYEYTARAYRDAAGDVVIEWRLQGGPGRRGLENDLYTANQRYKDEAGVSHQAPAGQIDLRQPPGMSGPAERSHLAGQGTGFEGRWGIGYAPPEVNQVLQRQGIEGFLSELSRRKPPGVEFVVQASAEMGKGQKWKSVEYTLHAELDGRRIPDVITFKIGDIWSKPKVKGMEIFSGRDRGSPEHTSLFEFLLDVADDTLASRQASFPGQ